MKDINYKDLLIVRAILMERMNLASGVYKNENERRRDNEQNLQIKEMAKEVILTYDIEIRGRQLSVREQQFNEQVKEKQLEAKKEEAIDVQ